MREELQKKIRTNLSQGFQTRYFIWKSQKSIIYFIITARIFVLFCQQSEYPVISQLNFCFFFCHLSESMNFCYMTHFNFSFADRVSSFFLHNHFMTSIDVESLFTSIPLNKVISICIDNLFCDANTIHNLDHNDMREPLTLAACDSCFIFDQVMYRQIDSVVMGS